MTKPVPLCLQTTTMIFIFNSISKKCTQEQEQITCFSHFIIKLQNLIKIISHFTLAEVYLARSPQLRYSETNNLRGITCKHQTYFTKQHMDVFEASGNWHPTMITETTSLKFSMNDKNWKEKKKIQNWQFACLNPFSLFLSLFAYLSFTLNLFFLKHFECQNIVQSFFATNLTSMSN